MEFLTYRSFYTLDEATELAQMLNSAGIPSRIEKLKQFLDHNIIGETQDQLIELKIPSTDFKKANDLIDESIRKNLSAIGDDHYLHSFNNAELVEIINNPSEWSRQDVVIAQHLLDNRHVNFKGITDTGVLKEKKYIPEKAEPSWLVLSYMLTLFGLMGFFAGLSLLIASKVMPDGVRVSMYDKKTKNHGKLIMILSTASIFLSFFREEFLILNLFGFFSVFF